MSAIGRSEKKVILLCLGALLSIAMAFLIYKVLFGNDGKDDFDWIPPAVKVETAKLTPICRFVKTNGSLKAGDSVEVKAEVDAKVSKIHFLEGADVSQGDLLVEFDSARAEAELKEAEAQYAKVRAEYLPSSKLATNKVVSDVKVGQLKAEMDSLAATIETRKVNLSKYKIYAPFSGKVGLKNISEGQYVNNGATITKVVDTKKLLADFKVLDINIADVYQGQVVEVSVDGNSNVYRAEITAIDPESDKMTHAFSVRAVVTGHNEQQLKPGMYVRINIPLDSCKQGITIPESALERYGDSEYVVRITKENKAIRTPVVSGYRNAGLVEIMSGLLDGDTVVTEGQQRVVDGRDVLIEKNVDITSFANRKLDAKK